MTTKERFFAKVDKAGAVPAHRPELGPCWQWTGHNRGKGYGGFWDENELRTRQAHAVAYEMFVGPIPNGLQIDHLCRNRRCVRPEHLEPVTSRVNTLRGRSHMAKNAAKTACDRGHPFSEQNTQIWNGWRYCKICRDERKRVKRANDNRNAKVLQKARELLQDPCGPVAEAVRWSTSDYETTRRNNMRETLAKLSEVLFPSANAVPKETAE